MIKSKHKGRRLMTLIFELQVEILLRTQTPFRRRHSHFFPGVICLKKQRDLDRMFAVELGPKLRESLK